MARRLQHDMTPDRGPTTWMVGLAVVIAIVSLIAWSLSAGDRGESRPVATSTQQQQPLNGS